jgi:hypothetical protein
MPNKVFLAVVRVSTDDTYGTENQTAAWFRKYLKEVLSAGRVAYPVHGGDPHFSRFVDVIRVIGPEVPRA